MAHDDNTLVTSPTLLRGIRSDDDALWQQSATEFYLRYRGFIYCICKHLHLQDSDIEIVINNVLSKFFDREGKWTYRESYGSFRKFFSTIIRNAAIDLVRKQSRQRTVALPDGTPEGGGAELHDMRIQEAIDLTERGELLQQACKRVQKQAPAVAWQAWQCCMVNNEDPKAVARFLKVSLASVYNYCKQINRLVREAYESLERE